MARKKRGGWQAQQETTQSADKHVYVSVYCDGRDGDEASPHDEQGRWRLASFYFYATDEGLTSWQEYGKQYIEPLDEHTVRVIPTSRRVTQMLDGDRWVEKVVYSPEFRIRWNFKCPVCGLSRIVSQPSQFFNAFAALSQVGKVEIPLRRLVHAQGS